MSVFSVVVDGVVVNPDSVVVVTVFSFLVVVEVDVVKDGIFPALIETSEQP